MKLEKILLKANATAYRRTDRLTLSRFGLIRPILDLALRGQFTAHGKLESSRLEYFEAFTESGRHVIGVQQN